MVWVAIGWMVGIAWGAPSFWAALICGAAALVSRLLGRRAISLALGLGLLGGLCPKGPGSRARDPQRRLRAGRRRALIHGYVAAEPYLCRAPTRARAGGRRPSSMMLEGPVLRASFGDRESATSCGGTATAAVTAAGRAARSRRRLWPLLGTSTPRASGTMAWVQVTSLPGRVGSWWFLC